MGQWRGIHYDENKTTLTKTDKEDLKRLRLKIATGFCTEGGLPPDIVSVMMNLPEDKIRESIDDLIEEDLKNEH